MRPNCIFIKPKEPTRKPISASASCLSTGAYARTELRLGKPSKAVADCRLSLRLARQTQNSVFIGSALCQLGLVDRKAGRLAQAFDDFTEAVQYSHLGKDLRWESRERVELGELLQESGKNQEAYSEYLKAELLSKSVADPSSLLEAEYSLARW